MSCVCWIFIIRLFNLTTELFFGHKTYDYINSVLPTFFTLNVFKTINVDVLNW